MKNYIITATQAQSIIDIACNSWKHRLAASWGGNIVLNKDIEIAEESYQEMREACTAHQNKLFDTIFPETNPFKAGDWVKIIQRNTTHTNKVIQLTEENIGSCMKGYHIYLPETNTDWRYPEQIRLATKEEIASVKYPKNGTPCLVRDYKAGWNFRYADGKGNFYNDSKKSGNTVNFTEWRILDMNNLPINK